MANLHCAEASSVLVVSSLHKSQTLEDDNRPNQFSFIVLVGIAQYQKTKTKKDILCLIVQCPELINDLSLQENSLFSILIRT